MRETIVGWCLTIAGVLAASPSWAVVLGNPGNGRLYSGIGVISGWKCEADGDLTIVFNDDGNHIPLVYGTRGAPMSARTVNVLRMTGTMLALWPFDA